MSSIASRIRARWAAEGGYRQVLIVSVPLMISSGGMSIQFVVDRVFLTWYDTDAMAASIYGGILSFTILNFFMGIAGYVSAFVAQYHGAGRPERIGPALGQGLYVGLIAGLLHLPLIPLAPTLFAWFGHADPLPALEAAYFQTLCWRAGPAVACVAISSYLAGLGRTMPVMWSMVAGTLVNVVLDYPLIHGWGPIPAMGIVGAGWATTISQVVTLLLFVLVLLQREHRVTYRVFDGWRLDAVLFRRLLRFGLPVGINRLLEISCFTAFVALVGRIGAVELGATAVTLDINSMVFMPVFGMGTAVTVLVGQFLGEERPDKANYATHSALQLAWVYVLVFVALYAGVPRLLLWPFGFGANAADWALILPMAVVLLRFVAAYTVLDTMTITLMSALLGAGDTRFVMWSMVGLSFLLMVVPSFLAVLVFGAGIYTMWCFLTLYVVVLSGVLLWRFRQGKWQAMRVIEAAPALLLPPGESPLPMLGEGPSPYLLSAPPKSAAEEQDREAEPDTDAGNGNSADNAGDGSDAKGE